MSSTYESTGVILLSAAQNGVPVFEYSPLEVKNAVVGYVAHLEGGTIAAAE